MTRQGVLVRDLIRDTEWHPSQDYDSAQPVVSVLLPTFRRGASGLFLKAALSVLGQTLSELELIIVDDGSTDGTTAQIQELMRQDPRVSLLRHPRNVGLPAVSEYEAYTKARADYFAFAFDDDEFHPDAIERLLGFARAGGHAVVHGHVEVRSWDDLRGEAICYSLGRGGAPPTVLRVANTIANSSLLLHRRVVETVGFFDPHVAVARVCDWDLWRRTAAAFRIVAADVPVGIIGGPATRDSLERTYPLDQWLSHEWCDRPRNARLLPGAIEEYDVLEKPAELSRESAHALEEIRSWHSGRWWFPREPSTARGGTADGSSAGALPEGRLLVVTGTHDASTTLCFDHLPDEARMRVRLVYPSFHPQEMIGASAVVFVRHLTNLTGLVPWIELAARLAIPHYYFLDDNFIVLSSAPEHRDELPEYTPDWVRKRLSTFAGVLLSTEALRDYFRRERLHETLLLYPPIARRPSIEEAEAFPPKAPGALRVAFFGGAHRIGPFVDVVVPALARAAREFPLEVVAAGSGEGLGGLSQAARVLTVPFETSYDVALSRFAKGEIDVLCHPSGENANNPFKTLNVLINAWAMGAVPVVSDGPPYDQLRGEYVAVLCPNTSDAWLQALRKLRRDPGSRRRTSERLDRYCRSHFAGQENVEAIRGILQAHAPAGLVLRDARARRAMDLLRDPVPVAAPPLALVPPPSPSGGVIADPVMRAPTRALPGRVTLRIPVGRARWCGADVDVGADAPAPEAGEYVARLLAEGGGCLRETPSLPWDGKRGWLVFRFPAVANSTGQVFDLEITAPGAELHATWSRLRSTPHIAYRLLFEV